MAISGPATCWCAGERIAGFVDPAIYCGSPEIELAFGTMFGTFGEAFFEAYESPAAARARLSRDCGRASTISIRALVHVRLFGSSYLAGIERDTGEARLASAQKRTGPDGPGRSSLRNEPSSKGMAFSGLWLAPPSCS